MQPGVGLDRCGKSRPTEIRFPNRQTRGKSLYGLPSGSCKQLQHYPLYVPVAFISSDTSTRRLDIYNARNVKQQKVSDDFRVPNTIRTQSNATISLHTLKSRLYKSATRFDPILS